MTTPIQPRGGPQGYPKSRRLIKSKEFKRVFELGEKIVCPQMVLLLDRSTEGSRIGIVASKKVGGAVTRNRIKRTLREIYRTLPYAIPGDLVVIARSSAREGTYKDLALAFDQCYKRLRKKLEYLSQVSSESSK